MYVQVTFVYHQIPPVPVINETLTTPGVGGALNVNNFSQRLAVSYFGGAVVGSLLTGFAANKYSRKYLLLGSCAVSALATVGMTISAMPDVDSLTLFLAARSVNGLAIGAFSVLCPLYIAEISHSDVRAEFVMFFQVAVTLGILISSIVMQFVIQIPYQWACAMQVMVTFFTKFKLSFFSV